MEPTGTRHGCTLSGALRCKHSLTRPASGCIASRRPPERTGDGVQAITLLDGRTTPPKSCWSLPPCIRLMLVLRSSKRLTRRAHTGATRAPHWTSPGARSSVRRLDLVRDGLGHSATIPSAMRAKGVARSMNPQARAAEKRRSRRLDERAISSGGKSVAQLKRENEVFAPLAADARIELAASRSLG